MTTMKNIQDHIDLYRSRMYAVFSKFDNENMDLYQLDNYKLSYIAELYSSILLTKKYKRPFYIFDDLSVDYKRNHNLSSYDSGIDILDKENCVAQCKLRKQKLSWNEITTFLSHLWATNKEGIICHNKGIRYSQQLDLLKHKIRWELFDRNELIQYSKKLLTTFDYNEFIEKHTNYSKKLRPYQLECLELIRQCEIKNKNMLVNLPTGSGKSVIIASMLNINKKILILVPRIILLEQIKNTILEFYPIYKDHIELVGTGYSNTKIHKNIVICVYNSIDKIQNVNEFDRIIIDEIHHILKPWLYVENDVFDNISQNDEDTENENNTKYLNTIHNLCQYNNVVGFSATVDKHDEFEYYTKDVRWMIDNDYLCDYEIEFPIFYTKNDLKVCHYLIEKRQNTIIFCQNRKYAKKITDILNQCIPNCAAYIDCDTNKTQRRNIIQQYNSNNIKFLVNVRILVEGFNSPITQNICLLNVPTSKLLMIQILGRALRKHPNKNKARILFPLELNEEYKTISKCIEMIFNNDKKYYQFKEQNNIQGLLNFKISNDVSRDNTEINYNDIEDYMYSITLNSMGLLNEIGKWQYYYKQLNEFFETRGKRPTYNTKDQLEYKLAVWMNRNNQYFKNNQNIMKNPDIKQLWCDMKEKYTYLLYDNEEKWLSILNEIKEHLNRHKKRPNEKSDDPKEKFLGNWLTNNLKNNKNISKKSYKYEEWNNFIKEYQPYLLSKKDLWFDALDKNKLFIDVNKKRPSSKSKDEYERRLGQWFSHELQNYKNNTGFMIDPERKQAFEDFLKNYKIYFITKKDIWYQRLHQTELFIDNFEKRPSDTSKDEYEKMLGNWLQSNLQNYKKNRGILKEKGPRESWNEFIHSYSKYLLTYEQEWFLTLEELKIFIKLYGRKPSRNSKDPKEKRLAAWINTNNLNLKKNQKIMKNEEIRQTWINFKVQNNLLTVKELWVNSLDELEEYIKTNDKRPNKRSKDDLERKLGEWLGHRLQNYKNKTGFAKDENLKQKWEDFIVKYKSLFE